MSTIYDETLGGGGLLWVGAAGLAVGFLAAKLGISDMAKSRLSYAISIGAAALCALGATTPSSNGLIVEILGRGAIFGIVWFVFSILFALGFSAGLSLGAGNVQTVAAEQHPEKIVIACPACAQKLRIPDRHDIEISCPKCRHKFIR